MALHAYCHERHAHRTFLVSRIQAAYDVETGEQIEIPVDCLMQRFNDSPIGRFTNALAMLEPKVLALAFVARADGRMMKNERQVIYDYMDEQTP